LRRELADPKITEHRRRIVKATGDGLLAGFASVVDAVRCAVEMQREIAARNAPVPASPVLSPHGGPGTVSRRPAQGRDAGMKGERAERRLAAILAADVAG